MAQEFNAILYLVNYAKSGTKYEDEVLLMRVRDIDPSVEPPIKTSDKKFTREEYSDWFRKLNERGQRHF